MSWLFIPGAPPNCGFAAARSGHLAAAIAFVLIFPTYFYYQTLVNAEFLAPILGGYFTAGAAAATPLLIYGAMRHRLSIGAGTVSAAVFAFFLLLFGAAALAGIQRGADDEITSSHLAYLFKFCVLFLVARLVDAQAAGFRRLTALLLIAIIGLVLITGQDGRFLQAAVLSELTELPFLLDYQGLAYAFIVIALYCLPQLRRTMRYLLYCASLASLFLIGARSEFAGFLVMAMVIEYCHARARAAFLSVVLLGMTALSTVYLLNQDAVAEHRIFGLLKLSSDQSAQERAEMHSAALRTIADNPFSGAYASYEPGHYAHNIFSAWVDIGLVGFTTLVLLQALPIAMMLRRFGASARDPLYVQVLAAQVLTTLLLLLAKNYTYQMIPVALGLYCRYRALQARPLPMAKPSKEPTLLPACTP